MGKCKAEASQLLGSGLLTFLSVTSGFTDLFREDHVAFYEDLDELVEKLDFFARNDDARRRVAESGWRAAHSMFASHRVAKYILARSFDEPLSESYPWPTAIETTPQESRPRSASRSIAS
jgi:hypothetical protein